MSWPARDLLRTLVTFGLGVGVGGAEGGGLKLRIELFGSFMKLLTSVSHWLFSIMLITSVTGTYWFGAILLSLSYVRVVGGGGAGLVGRGEVAADFVAPRAGLGLVGFCVVPCAGAVVSV